jgi:hypothetical protein
MNPTGTFITDLARMASKNFNHAILRFPTRLGRWELFIVGCFGMTLYRWLVRIHHQDSLVVEH